MKDGRMRWSLILLGCLTLPVLAEQPVAEPPARAEWLLELDPYYSSVGWQIPLTADAAPYAGTLSEPQVYHRLWTRSLHPDLLLFEASVYPLPLVGCWMKRDHPDTYQRFEWGSIGNSRFNLLESLTAGFQEPWAISAFVGSGMRFDRLQADSLAHNRAYMGYLLSFGLQHIRQNVLIDDPWWELEWKLKGEREALGRELSWSFRLGLKEHGNRQIADVLYLGLRRNSLDFNVSWLSWLDNSDMEWLTEISQHDLHFLRQEITVGYKWPVTRWQVSLGLDVGLILEEPGKYSGELASSPTNRYTVVLRPKLSF